MRAARGDDMLAGDDAPSWKGRAAGSSPSGPSLTGLAVGVSQSGSAAGLVVLEGQPAHCRPGRGRPVAQRPEGVGNSPEGVG